MLNKIFNTNKYLNLCTTDLLWVQSLLIDGYSFVEDTSLHYFNKYFIVLSNN